MKLSEAITELHRIMQVHGDVELIHWSGEKSYPINKAKFDVWHEEFGRKGKVLFAIVSKE